MEYPTHKAKVSREAIDLIKDEANENIELVLSELGVDVDSLIGLDDEIRCPCPIHGGDNPTAFSYNKNYKSWRCYTNNCHNGANTDIIGLVQLLLGDQRQENVSFMEALNWLAGLLKIDIGYDSENVSPEDEAIARLVRENKLRNSITNKSKPKMKESSEFPIPLSLIDGKVEPSWYFLDQGFTEDILRKYNVGYCDNPRKPMYLRSYAPVLDEEGKNIIGVTGRIKYEKCDFCPYFHETGKGCPTDNKSIKGYSKWSHYGFNTNSVVYNSWFAEPFIRKTGIAIVTEGPKDVWWLEQHGIHNSVCVFGLKVLDYHLHKLIKMGTMKVVVALDNDEKGIEAMERMNESLAIYFKMININNLLSSGEDIADISTDRMNKNIVPFLKNLEK